MDKDTLIKYAIGGAILFAAFKFGGKWGVAGATAVGAVIIAKNVPYLKDVI